MEYETALEQLVEPNEQITSGWEDPTPENEWGPLNWAVEDEEIIQAINNEKAASSPIFTNPLDFNGDLMRPTYLADELGQFLLTPGLIHTFYGPSGSKKSFIAMSAVSQVHGFYLDLEMGIGLLSKRLKDMDFDYSQSDGYRSITSKEEFEETINNLLAFYQPTVVVIDSFTQLATILGKDSNNGEDTGVIYQKYLRPLAAKGFTVVTTDHSPKSGSANDHPIGSQNKKAQLDVAYRIQVNENSGHSEIYLAKDRMYLIQPRLPEGSNLVGEIRLSFNPLRVRIIPNGMMSQIHQIPGLSNVEYQILDRQISAIKRIGPITKSDLDIEVTGKSMQKSKCRQLLVDNGFLIETTVKEDGKRAKIMLLLTAKEWIYTTM